MNILLRLMLHIRFMPTKVAPVVPVGVCWWFLPALVGIRVQQTVVCMDGMAQVISVILLS